MIYLNGLSLFTFSKEWPLNNPAQDALTQSKRNKTYSFTRIDHISSQVGGVIVSVVFSWSYCLLINDFGEAYFVGHSDGKSNSILKLIPPDNGFIIEAACGINNIHLVSKDGNYWLFDKRARTWKNLNQILNVERPEKCEDKQIVVTKVACGTRINLAVDNLGALNPRPTSRESSMNGVWFEQQGEVLMSGDKWTIVIEINVTEIQHELAELQSRTQDTAFKLIKAASKMPALEVQTQTLERIQSMETELMATTLTLTDLCQSRSRRGLINLGGKLLRVLFGVAEDEDLQTVLRSEEALKLQTASLLHIEKGHLSITRELSRQTVKTNQDLGRISKEVYARVANVERNLHSLSSQTSATDTLLRMYMNVTNMIQNLELATYKAMLDLRKILFLLNQLANGQLSVELISPLELSVILERARSSLPGELELVFGTGTSQIFKYYQLIKTSAITVNNVIKILLTVPLSSASRRFELFQATTLPVRDSSSNLTVRYELSHNLLLISQDRDRYATFSSEMLQRCEPGPITLCPILTPVYNRHYPSCLSSLFLGEHQSVKETCSLKVLADDPPDIWVWLAGEFSWAYSLAMEQRFISQCQSNGKMNVEEFKLRGTGLLKAARGCTISNPKYQILAPARNMGHSDTHQKPIDIYLPPLLTLAHDSSLASRLRTSIRERQQEGQLSPGPIGVDEIAISNLMYAVQQTEKLQPTSADDNTMKFICGGLALLFLGLLGVYCLYERCYFLVCGRTPTSLPRWRHVLCPARPEPAPVPSASEPPNSAPPTANPPASNSIRLVDTAQPVQHSSAQQCYCGKCEVRSDQKCEVKSNQ